LWLYGELNAESVTNFPNYDGMTIQLSCGVKVTRVQEKKWPKINTKFLRDPKSVT